MNTLKNKVNLIGRLGANPEKQTFDSGTCLTKFSLATNESYKDKNGEWKEITQWHTINAWGKIAEVVSNKLSKGQKISLEGRIVYKTYETESGQKRQTTIIELKEFLLFKEVELINKTYTQN